MANCKMFLSGCTVIIVSIGICSVVFETRLGCLNEVIPEETQKFIFSVGEMFRLSPIIVLFPKSVWPYIPFWKHFVVVWDYLFKVGKSQAKMTTPL